MVNIKVLVPQSGSKVASGTNGVLLAQIDTSGLFNIAGSVCFEIKDSLNNVIAEGSADIVNHQATYPVQWPAQPGNYVVTATCKGMVLSNDLGVNSIEFSVV